MKWERGDYRSLLIVVAGILLMLAAMVLAARYAASAWVFVILFVVGFAAAAYEIAGDPSGKGRWE